MPPTKNGTWRAWGMVAAMILAIAMTALLTSASLGGRVDGNQKDIVSIKQEQKEVREQLKWQRNALSAIAFKVGAKLPEEK